MRAFSLRSLLLSIGAIGICCGLLKVAATTSDQALRPVLVLVAILGLGGVIGAYFGDISAGVGYSYVVLVGALLLATLLIISYYFLWF